MDYSVVDAFPTADVETAWHDFLVKADFATHYAAPEFFREPFFADKRPFAVLAVDHGRVVGILTGMHHGDQVVSGLTQRPQVCLDESVDTTGVTRTLAEGLLHEADRASLITVYGWRPMPGLVEHGFRLKEEKDAVVVLDLRQGPDRLFKEFSENRRTNIRKAIKRGVQVAEATTRDQYEAFYEIYVEWCRAKRLPVVRYEVLEHAFSLRQNRRLFLASFDGRIIAGVVVRFYPGGFLEYAANSSLKDAQILKPNDLLHWRVIEWAYEHGLSRYSLGGEHLFLRKFGGPILPVYRHRLDRTWLQRHDKREALERVAREVVRVAPRPVADVLRRVTGRSS